LIAPLLLQHFPLLGMPLLRLRCIIRKDN
jgi:hypothetical protein